MNVSLTPDLERFVREKVDTGLYNSASEVVREALRLLVAQDREAAFDREAAYDREATQNRDAAHERQAAHDRRAAHHREEISYRVAEQSATTYLAPSEAPSLSAAASKFRQALEMLHLSYALMEQNLRRQDPQASDRDISRRLAAWKSDADWGEEAPGHLERSPDRLARLRRAAD